MTTFAKGDKVRFKNGKIATVEGMDFDYDVNGVERMCVMVSSPDRDQLEGYDPAELTKVAFCMTCGGEGVIEASGRTRACGACDHGIVVIS